MLDLSSRVTSNVARSLTLLHASEQHLRIHNTDLAVRLLADAEGHLANAQADLPGVSDEHRFSIQKQVNEAREQLQDFRIRMCEL